MQSKNKILGGVLNIFLRVQKGARAKIFWEVPFYWSLGRAMKLQNWELVGGPRKSVRQTWVEKQLLASELAKKLQELKLINI